MSWIELLTIALLLLTAGLLAISIVKGAPYLPSNPEAVSRMVKAAGIRPGTKVADLGSGDGRIVLAMGRAGAQAVGFEINPVLAAWSRRKIQAAGLSNRCRIEQGSFWSKDLSPFQVITVFGIDRIMPALQAKLEKDLRPGALVLSNVFSLPGWQGEKSGTVYVYRKT